MDDLTALNIKAMEKAKFTDKILHFMVYLSLVPSIFYNAIWIYQIIMRLESFTHDENLQCPDLYNWANHALVWCAVCGIKAFIFLFCLKCNNDESNDSNDCNMICILIKALSSYIPAIVFNFKLGQLLEGEYKSSSCLTMEATISLFKYCEYSYIIFFSTLLCGVPLMGILMCLKELWKSRKYKDC